MKKLIIFAAGALVAASVLADTTEGTAASSVDAAAVSTASDDVKIEVELKIGTDVQSRELVGESAAFGPEVEKVVAWTRVTGATQPTQITHVWKHDGKEVMHVPLNIQSASFRTFSRRTVAGETGSWSVDVQDANGKVIATKEFTVGK